MLSTPLKGEHELGNLHLISHYASITAHAHSRPNVRVEEQKVRGRGQKSAKAGAEKNALRVFFVTFFAGIGLELFLPVVWGEGGSLGCPCPCLWRLASWHGQWRAGTGKGQEPFTLSQFVFEGWTWGGLGSTLVFPADWVIAIAHTFTQFQRSWSAAARWF